MRGMRVTRLLRIVDRGACASGSTTSSSLTSGCAACGRGCTACSSGATCRTPRAVRLRLALEELGPIFVKFGQMLSTRRDLLPTDIADELAKLQDAVPPFPVEAGARHARALLSPSGRRGVRLVRPHAQGERVGGAGAFRPLPDGTPVAVKVLRPGIDAVIAARPRADAHRRRARRARVVRRRGDCVRARSWSSSRRRSATSSTSRARPPTARSCAATSSIRRCCWCPVIYWDFTSQEVLVMERMEGIPIGRVDELRRRRRST